MELLIPLVYLSRTTPGNIVADELARACSFSISVLLAPSCFVLKSLRKKGCPEQAWLIRYTCVETPALRDFEMWSHLFGVPSDRCRSMLWEIPAARCAVGRLAVCVVSFPLFSGASIYLSSLACNA